MHVPVHIRFTIIMRFKNGHSGKEASLNAERFRVKAKLHICNKTQKMYIFYINDLIKLYCFQHFPNNGGGGKNRVFKVGKVSPETPWFQAVERQIRTHIHPFSCLRRHTCTEMY
jgi:hypothetical protein